MDVSPLSIDIPAPASAPTSARASTRADFIARSAKGDIRTDPAAPPTVEGTLSFADLVDAVNPLQHVPGVNLAYRAMTGDSIEAPSNLAGGFLYGGPLGAVFAVATSVFSDLFSASETVDAAAVRVADANPARPDIYKSV